MIFFSVVIPTYNRGHFIEQGIHSLLNQTFQDFEVIIVDDGSTDNTEVILRQYVNNQFRYYKIENQERGYARNFGFRKSGGDYVVFLDSDDWFKPTHLENLRNTIVHHNSFNFYATKFDEFVDGEICRHSILKKVKAGAYDYRFLLDGNHLACNICIRRRNESLIPFHEDREFASLEDWLFLLYNLRNDRLFLSEEVTVSMREHSGRSMHFNKKVIHARMLATEWAEQHIEFSKSELKKLWGNSFYFCAIHSYLDGNRRQAFSFLYKAIKRLGLRARFVILFVKIIVIKKGS